MKAPQRPKRGFKFHEKGKFEQVAVNVDKTIFDPENLTDSHY
jgi:hypothetical protein